MFARLLFCLRSEGHTYTGKALFHWTVPQASGVSPTAIASFYVNLHSLRLLCPTQPFTFHRLLPSMASFETSHNGKLLSTGRGAEQNGPWGRLHVDLAR